MKMHFDPLRFDLLADCFILNVKLQHVSVLTASPSKGKCFQRFLTALCSLDSDPSLSLCRICGQ